MFSVNVPVGVHMLPLQGRQGPEDARREATLPRGLPEYLLNHQRVHGDEADLEQVQREHQQFLVVQLVRGELAPLAI